MARRAVHHGSRYLYGKVPPRGRAEAELRAQGHYDFRYMGTGSDPRYGSFLVYAVAEPLLPQLGSAWRATVGRFAGTDRLDVRLTYQREAVARVAQPARGNPGGYARSGQIWEHRRWHIPQGAERSDPPETFYWQNLDDAFRSDDGDELVFHRTPQVAGGGPMTTASEASSGTKPSLSLISVAHGFSL